MPGFGDSTIGVVVALGVASSCSCFSDSAFLISSNTGVCSRGLNSLPAIGFMSWIGACDCPNSLIALSGWGAIEFPNSDAW